MKLYNNIKIRLGFLIGPVVAHLACFVLCYAKTKLWNLQINFIFLWIANSGKTVTISLSPNHRKLFNQQIHIIYSLLSYIQIVLRKIWLLVVFGLK